MNDEFKRNKLKKENIALWRRYLSQEGLIEDRDDSLSFEDIMEYKAEPSSDKNGDSINSLSKSIEFSASNIGSNEIDGRTDQKLRQGKIKIDAKLDLHGLNRYEAREACVRFIQNCYSRGVRTVLIITGKGRAQVATHHIIEPEVGVLKNSLPEWLNAPEIRTKVLKYYPARPKDGGSGAFYVYIRKNK